MPVSVKVYKLWENGVYKASCPTVLNCDNLQGVKFRMVWLVLAGCCSSRDFTLSYQQPPDGTYYLSGVLTKSGTTLTVLDAASVEAITEACAACCGGTSVVTVPPVYNGILPPQPEPAPYTFYQVMRADNGSTQALQLFVMDYYGQYDLGYPVQRIAYDAGTGISTYEFRSNGSPFAIGSDTMTAAGQQFFSEPFPEITAGEWVTMQPVLDGATWGVLKATTLEDMVVLLNNAFGYADPVVGTWLADEVGNRIIFQSAIEMESVEMPFTVETIPASANYDSNGIDPLSAPFVIQLQMDLESGGDDVVNNATLQQPTISQLITFLNTDVFYSLMGTWSQVEIGGLQAVELTSSFIDNAVMTLSNKAPEGTAYSNEAPALTAGQWYSLVATVDEVPQYPVKADTLEDLLDLLGFINDYADMGTSWGIDGNFIYLLSPIGDVVLDITAETKPADTPGTSNVVAAPTPPDVYSFTGSFSVGGDAVAALPAVQGADMTTLIANLTADPQYSQMGTWTDGGTQVNFASPWITSSSLVLATVTP